MLIVNEPLAGKRRRAVKIIRRLMKKYYDPGTALYHGTPLDLLIATILSAQCTDERVNIVTKKLFSLYRTATDYADTDRQSLEEIIRSTGFYRSKSKNIINCCKMLLLKHGGTVPETMEELIQLPGVGRKTANVVLGNFFGISAGIVVDTHVKRLAGRLGLTDPVKIEKDLTEVIPKKHWINTGNLLIYHGRQTCTARKTKCDSCILEDLCASSTLR
jgi:endonuclease-3